MYNVTNKVTEIFTIGIQYQDRRIPNNFRIKKMEKDKMQCSRKKHMMSSGFLV